MLRLSVLLVSLLLAVPAVAMDRDEAAARVQQQTGGRVLGVERIEQGGRVVFRVRVLTPSGEVRVVEVQGGRGGRR